MGSVVRRRRFCRRFVFSFSFFPRSSSLTFASPSQGFFAKVYGYKMIVSRGANDYGAYLDHFAPAPLDCWVAEEWYDPVRYQKPKVAGETAHAYHINEAVAKGEALQKTVNRILVDTDECVCFLLFHHSLSRLLLLFLSYLDIPSTGY
jgi:hypothetical protein